MPRMEDGVLATGLHLDPEPLPPEEVVTGEPRAGSVELGRLGDCEVGVWEMTVGTARDVEVDEVFVVVAGAGTVRFVDEDRVVDLAPGTVVRLLAGQATEWTVTETVRKVYVAAG